MVAQTFIVTGTDTGIGKTSVAAMLTLGLKAVYWKPVQSGIEDGMTDTQRVQQLTDLPPDRFLPERYVLKEPLSPHRAAELDGVTIDTEHFPLPSLPHTLIVEGAGGLMVPITRRFLQIDLFAQWGAPLILCARTGLGTINHTLLSIEAIKQRGMNLHGVIFIGDDNPDNIRTIADYVQVRVLGRVPLVAQINHTALTKIFADHFKREDF